MVSEAALCNESDEEDDGKEAILSHTPTNGNFEILNFRLDTKRIQIWLIYMISLAVSSLQGASRSAEMIHWVGCPDGRCLLRQRNGVVRNRNRSDDVPEADETQSQEKGKEGQSFLLWLQP